MIPLTTKSMKLTKKGGDKMPKNKCVYVVEGYEDREFEDESEACEFLASITDFYTDDSLQLMCEEEIYEVCDSGDQK